MAGSESAKTVHLPASNVLVGPVSPQPPICGPGRAGRFGEGGGDGAKLNRIGVGSYFDSQGGPHEAI